MKVKIEEKIENEISLRVRELGFEIEYVEYVKEGDRNILRIVLDKKDGNVTIDDCELVSRDVEDRIDKLLSGEYVLEVSSPGVERQIKNIKLYKKYLNNEVYIKLFKKDEDGKEFTGILNEVNEEEGYIILKLEELEKKVELKNIATAHTVYDFDAVLKQNSDNVNLNKLNKFNKK